MDVWTIVVKPKKEQRSRAESEKAHYDKFDAFLNRTDAYLNTYEAYSEECHLLASASPLYDSAKLLIDQGENPNQLVTMQHHNRDHWSFAPQTLAFWATLEIPKKPKDGSTPRADALAALMREFPGTE